MDSGEASIKIHEGKTDAKGKAMAQPPKGGSKKGIAILDFVFRLCAVGAALGAAATMANTQQSLPFFTQFFQFQAQYNDIEAFVAFLIANAIVSGYLILSLLFSVICIIRPYAMAPRLLLIIFDTVMMGVTAAAASAAASIVYLAHNGNPNANWQAICQQFNDYCHSVSGAVVGSFIAAALLMLLIILSAFALKRDT